MKVANFASIISKQIHFLFQSTSAIFNQEGERKNLKLSYSKFTRINKY